MNLRIPAVALLALATSCLLRGQSPACEAWNDQTTTVSGAISGYGFAGPNTVAWQFTPASALVAQGARIFTNNNNVQGFQRLEVWSNDPATNLPQSRIAGGTWKIAQSPTATWQGANFDTIAVLTPGTQYWLVWNEPGFCRIPTELGGITLPYARLSGATWIPGTASALKLRLQCSLLESANVVPNGAPCTVAGSGLGTILCNQDPTVGNASFAIDATGFASSALAVLVLGSNPAFVSVPLPGFPAGCQQHTDAVVVQTGTTGAGNVRATAAANHVSFPLPIPANASLAGLVLGAQVACADANAQAPIPFVASNGLRLTLL